MGVTHFHLPLFVVQFIMSCLSFLHDINRTSEFVPMSLGSWGTSSSCQALDAVAMVFPVLWGIAVWAPKKGALEVDTLMVLAKCHEFERKVGCQNGELKWDTVKCSELRSYIFKMFRHGPKCFCAILLPGSRFWSLEPRFYEDVKIWGFGYGKRDLWCNHYHPRQHWLGQLQGCHFDDLKKTFKTLKHGKCERYGSEWKIHTHTHNIPTSYNWCDISCLFAWPLSFAHPARSVWVMRAWPTFKTRRLTKSPKSWLIEVFFMEDFHPPLYDTCHLSPKMGGGWIGRIQSYCQPGFFWKCPVDGQSLLIFVGTWSCHPWFVWSSVKDAVLGDMNIDTWDLFLSRKA